MPNETKTPNAEIVGGAVTRALFVTHDALAYERGATALSVAKRSELTGGILFMPCVRELVSAGLSPGDARRARHDLMSFASENKFIIIVDHEAALPPLLPAIRDTAGPARIAMAHGFFTASWQGSGRRYLVSGRYRDGSAASAEVDDVTVTHVSQPDRQGPESTEPSPGLAAAITNVARRYVKTTLGS